MLFLMFEPQNIDVVESLKKENKKLRKIIRNLEDQNTEKAEGKPKKREEKDTKKRKDEIEEILKVNTFKINYSILNEQCSYIFYVKEKLRKLIFFFFKFRRKSFQEGKFSWKIICIFT